MSYRGRAGMGRRLRGDYQECVLPGVTKRLAEMVWHDLEFQLEWESF